jgi:hypothetical protein
MSVAWGFSASLSRLFVIHPGYAAYAQERYATTCPLMWGLETESASRGAPKQAET